MSRAVRYVLLWSAVAGVALTCPAQSKHKSRPVKRPPRVSAEAPGGWTAFTSEEGGFRVLFPGVPQQSSQHLDLAGGESLMRIATFESPVVYRAMYISCPVDVADKREVEDYFDNLRVGELEPGGTVGPPPSLRVISETDMPLNQHPGRFLHVELKELVYRRRAVIANGRLYLLTAVTPNDAGRAPAKAKRYERLSMTFLNSLVITAGEKPPERINPRRHPAPTRA